MAKLLPTTIDETAHLLEKGDYVAGSSLATALFLAMQMKRPLYLEGEAGVGKTEIAKVLANTLDKELIRLQCYEGMDISSAVYEWNYTKQMIEIRLAEAQNNLDKAKISSEIFGSDFLIERPILRAIKPNSANNSPILLIDELDRTDEPFEAYLLEFLSDFQISIPEIGTIECDDPPIVIITSNRTREVHDALKRRCLYHWVDYPSYADELKILQIKIPEIEKKLCQQVVGFVQKLREEDLFKNPGTAETLDWANALNALNKKTISAEMIDDTLGVLLKYQDDISFIRGKKTREILTSTDNLE